MRRTTFITMLALVGLAVPAFSFGGPRPSVQEPEQAVATIKRVIKRTAEPCRTDWRRITALGYEGNWKVEAVIRRSRSGNGVARWTIGYGRPVPRNPLARDLSRGCGYATTG